MQLSAAYEKKERAILIDNEYAYIRIRAMSMSKVINSTIRRKCCRESGYRGLQNNCHTQRLYVCFSDYFDRDNGSAYPVVVCLCVCVYVTLVYVLWLN